MERKRKEQQEEIEQKRKQQQEETEQKRKQQQDAEIERKRIEEQELQVGLMCSCMAYMWKGLKYFP